MICGAMALVAAAVCVFAAHRDKPVVSPEPVTAQTVLVIDAGHGGEDGGAVSASGVPESNINLAIAQKTQLLLAFVGQVTIMTREGEEAIYSPDAQTLREKKVSDLSNRVKLVNETAGSILLSIHQNSLPGSKVRGAQVFYNAVEPAQQMAVSVQQALNSAVNYGSGKNAKQIDFITIPLCSRDPGTVGASRVMQPFTLSHDNRRIYDRKRDPGQGRRYSESVIGKISKSPAKRDSDSPDISKNMTLVSTGAILYTRCSF